MRSLSLTRRFARKGLSAVLLTLMVALNAPGDSASNLPSLDDLERLRYKASAEPGLVGMPSYSDLKNTIYSFQNYLRGVTLLDNFREPILTRGASGIAVYRAASPAIVLVVAGNVRYGQVTDLGTGTGVIVDSSGYVLTNWHVIRGFQEVLVFLKPHRGTVLVEGLGYAAHIITYDRQKDLALLKLVNPPARLPVIAMGSISQLQVAQDIHVIGHPGGLEHAWSYTTGVISQIRPHYEGKFDTGQEIRANLIQIQATVNPGNSGGPVLDDQGRMIGLISFGYTENMNFAIAGDEISRFLSYARQLTTRGGTAGTPDGPRAAYSAALLGNSRRVTRASYPDIVVYFVHEDDGKVVGLVGKASNGVVLQAWERGPTGGFNQWLAEFADGTEVQGTGKAGLPDLFVAK